jgi:hypothetical protein
MAAWGPDGTAVELAGLAAVVGAVVVAGAEHATVAVHAAARNAIVRDAAVIVMPGY